MCPVTISVPSGSRSELQWTAWEQMADLDSAGDIHRYKRRRRLAGRSDQASRLDLAHIQGKNHDDPTRWAESLSRHHPLVSEYPFRSLQAGFMVSTMFGFQFDLIPQDSTYGCVDGIQASTRW